MKTILFTIVAFILIGAIGMALANKKVNAHTARQRWLKYGMYLLITTAMSLLIWLKLLIVPAIIIALAGYYELTRTIKNDDRMPAIKALIVYTIIIFFFMLFALFATSEFQFLLYFQVFTFDAFCQVVGQLAGRNLIAPKVSPSKTFEGLLGGTLFCIVASMLVANDLKIHGDSIGTGLAVLSGLVTSATAFSGDMLASWYKRLAGIKDYSNLLPGQGGFLDRFDSFLVAASCYTILSFFFDNIAYFSFSRGCF